MENANKPVHSLEDLASLLMEKLKSEQTDLTLDFQDMQVQGPGPQGAPGQWRINGKVSLKAKSNQKG
ncbi:hypothetical protein [Rufibacter roseus]|uniref:Uncharacterized protein n=1 Tax=Rufibacter roseus TaxID=1567108 RepID=A0ABW2DNY5_9BACT|nr:hypothetical protein [Rufibacter roseus]